MRFRVLIVLSLFALSYSPQRASAQIGVSYLKLAPQEGHPGAPLFVTGAGFKPGASEVLTMACPSALTVSSPGDYEVQAGPTADAQGRFVGFKMNAVAPPNLTLPLPCTVYANVGNSQFGPDIRGHYLLIPPRQKVDSHATHIYGVRVSATPVRVRTGFLERITVRDDLWPGAHVSVGLHYAGNHQDVRRAQLDFAGSTYVRWPVRVHVAPHSRPMRVAVTVHLQLGPAGGGGTSSFYVVH